MSQQFLLSSRARTLSLGTIARMGDVEVEAAFMRWTPKTGQLAKRESSLGAAV